MYWLYLTIALFLSSTSCTQNVSLVHTQGEATDVVDTSQSPTNDVKPDVNLEIPGV